MRPGGGLTHFAGPEVAKGGGFTAAHPVAVWRA
jgi:hypothetical protein